MNTFDYLGNPFSTRASEPQERTLTAEKLAETFARFRRQEPAHKHLNLEVGGYRVSVILNDAMPDDRVMLIAGKGAMADLEKALTTGKAEVRADLDAVGTIKLDGPFPRDDDSGCGP